MTYFRELPDLEYQSFLSTKTSSHDYLLVKNIFQRVKLRNDLQNVFTIFDKYQIVDGARPDTVAKELYGSSQYDWVVLITAGIINVRDQWPLSDKDLYNYCEEVYGNNLNSIHHYETTEVKDPNNRLILPAGKVVDSSFKVTYFYGNTLYTNDSTILGSNVVYISNSVIGVSNYEYEVRKNDKKRTIYLLKPGYLQQVIKDIRSSLIYDQSSQYVNPKLIKTENTRNTIL